MVWRDKKECPKEILFVQKKSTSIRSEASESSSHLAAERGDNLGTQSPHVNEEDMEGGQSTAGDEW